MIFKRYSLIKIHLTEKARVPTVRAFHDLNIKKLFISRIIARYSDTGSIAQRQGSRRKKSVKTPDMIRKVEKRIERNQRSSSKKKKKMDSKQWSIISYQFEKRKN